jgi:[ribosomal protein S18]-alanine N-acetyltransferase
MSVEVTLRPMRWWHIQPVIALEDDLFPEDAWSPAMFWSELAEASTRHYLIAQADGPDAEIVGYAGLFAAGRQADVQTIAVRRDHWGTGVGSMLLTALLVEAARRGCREVLLEVRVDNERAQHFYRRFGFVAVGVRRGYYQPANVDAILMKLADLPAWRAQLGQVSDQGVTEGRSARG